MGVNAMNIAQAIEPSKTDRPSLFTDRAPADTPAPDISRGDKSKARDILAAIRTLHALDEAQRPATLDERQILLRFPGFGPVALGIFPDRHRYPDSWQPGELQVSSRRRMPKPRTTFMPSTPRPVIHAMRHSNLACPRCHRAGAGLYRRLHRPGAWGDAPIRWG
jgi:hypothetical protein